METSPAPTDKHKSTDRLTGIRSIAELLLALVLIVIGLKQLYTMDKVEAWVPIALIGLGLLFYTLRGRVVSDAEVGPGGIKFKLEAIEKKADDAEQKAIAAAQQAQDAAKTADFSKALTTQIGASVPAAHEGLARELSSPWSHPDLKPSAPPPEDDPQKGQWGGEAERNGRILEAKVTETDDPDWFEVRLEVRSTDPSRPLDNRVRFHLHDSYRVSKVIVKPKDHVASIERYAYGAFTVGAEVENEPGTFLELDLANVDAPARFKAR